MDSTMPPAAAARAQQFTALRRQLILEAAQRVFERDGLEKTTVRAIAKEAGCTTGAIYPWFDGKEAIRSEEHTSELQSLMRISYAVFCLKKKKYITKKTKSTNHDYKQHTTYTQTT